jgi:hypothetical protein
MTSKRLGILGIVLFALWSLAGSDWFVSSSSCSKGLGITAAYAGDPDTYTSTQSTTTTTTRTASTDGDPDSYTGDPGLGTHDDPNSSPPQDQMTPDDETDSTVLKIYKLALLAVWSVRGFVY